MSGLALKPWQKVADHKKEFFICNLALNTRRLFTNSLLVHFDAAWRVTCGCRVDTTPES
jgi:hypothetical protein